MAPHLEVEGILEGATHSSDEGQFMHLYQYMKVDKYFMDRTILVRVNLIHIRGLRVGEVMITLLIYCNSPWLRDIVMVVGAQIISYGGVLLRAGESPSLVL